MRLPSTFFIVLFFSIVPTFAQETPTPPPPLPRCSPTEIDTALNALPAYTPVIDSDFVRIEGDAFVTSSGEYRLRGINYYPMRAPWRRFLAHSDVETVATELDLLRQTGFNSLRIFLWNNALFTCPGSGAIPNMNAFLRLDTVIRLAAEHDFRLIVTLNDLPDLSPDAAAYPLYDNPLHIQLQTAFIVQRYRDEAAILAWDVRNEGDIDYGSNNPTRVLFPREKVLIWLEQASAQVRSLDPNHLITAGWLYDNEATIPYVDFVSFHHWGTADELRQRIINLRDQTSKPILLQEFGYSTFNVSEEEQARLIRENKELAETYELAGWMIWTAFDFPLDATCNPPACPDQENMQHHFGLWRTDYTPKPAVEVLQKEQ
jgi:endo-1,4-beta-mannosidase